MAYGEQQPYNTMEAAAPPVMAFADESYPVPADQSWRFDKLCSQIEPDLFFPERGEKDRSKAAKKICQACDVRLMCLDYALDNDERFGIWGGTTEYERRKLRRQT